ncbi:MAG: hypothetical protein KQ78_01436 [Candidatus Izimaplasma bacterium HR2]|nr:MAG: hypothetical protein KQ78_01436 [Candidatus Izimaplasma bacterium HR2]
MFGKKKKNNRLLSLVIFPLFFIITLYFSFSGMEISSFIGNLEKYSEFTFVEDYKEDIDYQFLRVLSYEDNEVAYAIHSSDINTSYIFYNENSEVVIEIDSDELVEDDFYLFTIEDYNRKVLTLKVFEDSNLINTLEFMYLEDYEEANNLSYNHENYDDINLTNIVDTHELLENNLLKSIIQYFLFGGALLGLVYIIAAIRKKKEDPDLESYAEMRQKLKEKKTKKIEPKEKKELTKPLRILKYIGINMLISLVVTYGIIIIIGTFVYDESSSEFLDYSELYFNEVNDDFDISLYIGISESLASDSDYGLDTVVYTVVYDKAPDELLVGSFLCDGEYFGRSFSDSGAIYGEHTDIYYRQIEIWRYEDCASADSFTLVLRNPNTAMTVFESEEYDLYKTADSAKEAFDLEEEDSNAIYLLYIYLFNATVTATLIRLGVKRLTKKDNQIEERYQ